jgi:hypothetical protein
MYLLLMRAKVRKKNITTKEEQKDIPKFCNSKYFK